MLLVVLEVWMRMPRADVSSRASGEEGSTRVSSIVTSLPFPDHHPRVRDDHSSIGDHMGQFRSDMSHVHVCLP